MRIAGLVMTAVPGLAACQGEASSAPYCQQRTFEGDAFMVCRFDAQSQDLQMAWRGGDGAPYRGFAMLKQAVGEAHVAFAMNAGMFDAAGAPIGLYVEAGKELHAISTTDGPGNFHLKPNGVFWIDAAGDPHVTATDAYLAAKPAPAWATQSGPMLVVDGNLHPAFSEDGTSRYVRNGVGVVGDHTALFVISDGPVSFGKMARFFRDDLNSANALYFDGAVSSLWAPSLNRMDTGFPLGPLVVITSPSPSRP